MKKESAKKSKFTPLADRVLVRPFSPEEKKSPSGIIIPDTITKEKPEQGTVVAVGKGGVDHSGKLIPLTVKIGDTVLFSKYGYDEVKIDGEEYFLLKEDSILGIIN